MTRRFLILVVALGALVAACGPSRRTGVEATSRLGAVRNWLYVLQAPQEGQLSPEAIGAAGYDLVVTDHSRSGDRNGIFSYREVERMKGPEGRGLVLAYMSVGEAESYRFYWAPQWSRGERPAFIGPVNEQWEGNFWVRYWDPAWRAILFGRGTAYLDRILAAGFDGVYLDKIDAYLEVPEEVARRERRIDPRAEMIRLVCDLSAYAKARRPGFVVMAQNAEELVVDPAYLAAIDGIGREEIWFAATDRPCNAAESAKAVGFLSTARGRGKTILTVDYCTGENGRIARKNASDLGFIPFVTAVALDVIPVLAKGASAR